MWRRADVLSLTPKGSTSKAQGKRGGLTPRAALGWRAQEEVLVLKGRTRAPSTGPAAALLGSGSASFQAELSITNSFSNNDFIRRPITFFTIFITIYLSI